MMKQDILKKISTIGLVACSSIMLASCSIGPVKLIDKKKPVQQETPAKKTFEHSGIIFEEYEKDLYAKENISLKDSPKDGVALLEVKQGDKVAIKFLSKDGKIAVVNYKNAPAFLDMEKLDSKKVDAEVPETTTESKKPVETKPETTTEPTTTEPETTAPSVATPTEPGETSTEPETTTEPSTTNQPTTPAEPTTPVAPPPDGLGVPYPAAPDSIDLYDGVTFAILSNVNAEVAAPGFIYEKSIVGAAEIAKVKVGDKVKVLAVGTNGFCRIELEGGKVGFFPGNQLKVIKE